MIQQFLQAKHWQLAIPAIGPIFLNRFILVDLSPQLSLFLGSLSLLTFLAWVGSIIIGLGKQLKEEERPQKWKLIVAVVYIILYVPLFFFIIGLTSDTRQEIGDEATIPYGVLLLPLHILALISIVSMLYWAARTLKILELKRKPMTTEVLSELFMIWLFPIGIWVVQPRINKLVSKES